MKAINAHNSLRAKAERRVGGPIAPVLWDEVLQRLEQDLHDTAEEDAIDWLMAVYRALDRRGPDRREQTLGAGIMEDFAARTRVLTRAAADAARHDPAVVNFRMQTFGGLDPLTNEQALELIQSGAATVLPASWLPATTTPTAGFDVISRHLDPDDGTLRLDVLTPSGRKPWRVKGEFVTLRYRPLDGGVYIIGGAEGSLIDALRRAAQDLAHSYPWDEDEAAAFILEGVRPIARPLRRTLVQYPSDDPSRPSRFRLTLEIDPWVPSQVVVAAYRAVQREVMPSRGRPIERRSMELVTFVLDYRAAQPSVTWPALFNLWNTAVTVEWRYDTYRHFRLAFQRARQSLLFPKLRWIGRLPPGVEEA